MPADRPAISGIDHVQITIPPGTEDEARHFYCVILGLTETSKPESLVGRGGFWCQVGGLQLHIGTEDGFDRLTTKAHVAYAVDDIALWQRRLTAAGCLVLESITIPGRDRFETRDPFGNRIELIEVVSSES
jgi:catechol 2,3-dioxygenase-like lactoylglutathione lyase family enzyme